MSRATIVDLPPEEEELCLPALEAGINFIYLAAPTTTKERLPKILKNASGFIYYVSITGITGTAAAALSDVKLHVEQICSQTTLPIAVGFGIRTPEQAKNIGQIADAAVVGSVLVDCLKDNLDKNDKACPQLVEEVLSLVEDLATNL